MERTTLSATSSIVSLLEPLWCLAGHHDWRAPPVSPPGRTWAIGLHNHPSTPPHPTSPPPH